MTGAAIITTSSDPVRPSRLLLSVVMPVYNEAGTLPSLLRRLAAVATGMADELDCEFIFVDDGCRDASSAVLKQLASSDARVKMVKLSRNFGHQIALTAGLEAVWKHDLEPLE